MPLLVFTTDFALSGWFLGKAEKDLGLSHMTHNLWQNYPFYVSLTMLSPSIVGNLLLIVETGSVEKIYSLGKCRVQLQDTSVASNMDRQLRGGEGT